MNSSKFLGLDWRDALKGLIVAIMTAFLTALIPMLEAGTWPSKSQLLQAAIAGVTAAAAYLLKNVLTNSQGQIGKQEPK